MRAWLVAMAVAAGALLPVSGHADETTNPLEGCALPPIARNSDDSVASRAFHYLPSTCECLARKTGWHLVGGSGDNSCDFRMPPPWFDPSRASPALLKSWGVPSEVGGELRDPSVRATYFRGVRRRLNGNSAMLFPVSLRYSFSGSRPTTRLAICRCHYSSASV